MPNLLEDNELYDLIMDESEDELAHYGTPHEGMTPHSGRYEYGSGALPNQRPKDFAGYVNKLKQYGLNDEDIALGFGFKSVKEYKIRYDYETNLRGKPHEFCKYVDKLRKSGYSDDDVARMVGITDAKALNDKYGYSKAVWGKVPADYKLDSAFDRQIKELTKEGYSDAQIALALGVETNKFKAQKSIATNAAKLEFLEKNRQLQEGIKAEDGTWIKEPVKNRSERARILGVSESTLRSREEGSVESNAQLIFNTADMLKKEMQSHKYLDVGKGIAQMIGIKDDKLNVALEVLKMEGYDVINVQTNQLGTAKGNKTSILTLVPPGTTYQQLKSDLEKEDNVIHVINTRTEDGGETFRKLEKPTSIDSSRIFIKYAEDGGVEKDGLIELRRGVEDISLNKAVYAQVRIAVDDKYYLKGMALHTDNIPEGYDILVNSNKKRGTPIEKVFKELKPNEDNPENPFGASIKTDDERLNLTQRHYIDPKTGEEKLSAINVVNEEGDWAKWSKTIASQFLAKQKIDVIKKQLDLTFEDRKSELDEIMDLTNPVVRQNMLYEYAETTDKAAVNLKAISFPRQATKVILPFPDMKENECYCPGYENGETVALVRYPHAGPMEIPTLRVNNKYKEAKDLLGNSIDAIGIHPKTAAVLSGADFDGDTAIVIPIRSSTGEKITDIKSFNDLSESDKKIYMSLREFDTKTYKLDDSVPANSPKRMKDEKARGQQMGRATNLIADIVAKGAEPEEIVRAIKYSMVCVDAYKHQLDWKQAAKDFGIKELNKKYRAGEGGAATLMTKAKSPKYVPYRTDKNNFNAMTEEEKAAYLRGEKVYNYPKDVRVRKDPETGEVIVSAKSKLIKSYQMAETNDARTLISKTTPTQQEYLYADFANKLKDLANQARKSAREIVTYKTDPEAKAQYKAEVDELKKKVNLAIANKPLERKAQALGNRLLEAKKAENPDMDDEHYRKEQARCLEIARKRTGASKYRIDITPREWEAIQARAVSKTTLQDIFNNTDTDKIKKYAMPRTDKGLTSAQETRAKRLLESNYDITEVAKMLGVSTTTIYNNVDVASIRHSLIQARIEEN